jgi:hypothetical protein
MTRRAEGRHRRGVHVRERLMRAHVGAGVEFAEDPARAALHPAHAERDARLEVDGDEAAVLRGAQRDLLPGARAVAGVDLLALAVHRAHDGATEASREHGRDVGVRASEVLGAEAATHRLADHAHVGERHTERLGDVVAHPEDALRALPDGELPALPLGDRGVRFHRAVQRAGRGDLARDHDLGRGERRRDIAAFGDLGLAAGEVALDARTHGAGGERLLDGDGERGGLDGGAHQSCGGVRGLLRLGTDRGDRLSDIRDVGEEEARARRHVGLEDHVEHAGVRPGRAHIDAGHLAARCGGANDGGVRLVRPAQVGGVAGIPGRLAHAIGASGTRTDVRERGIRSPRLGFEGRDLHHALLGAAFDLDRGLDEAALGLGHAAGPRRVAAARRTARTIFG